MENRAGLVDSAGVTHTRGHGESTAAPGMPGTALRLVGKPESSIKRRMRAALLRNKDVNVARQEKTRGAEVKSRRWPDVPVQRLRSGGRVAPLRGDTSQQ